MWIDSHCHLDFISSHTEVSLFGERLDALNIEKVIVPTVSPSNIQDVLQLSKNNDWCHYAIGFHPLYVNDITHKDLELLDGYLTNYKPVAVGEIGLDFFKKNNNHDWQEEIFIKQLKLAKKHELPVILHVRGAIDDVLKNLRRINVCGGIAHAFNGSLQQANQFITMGFKLGFGGAMTYARATHLQTLAKILPLESIVLETDTPDIPPAWLNKGEQNSPEELPKIGQFLATIRGLKIAEMAAIIRENTYQALPKLSKLYT
ncbi:MAG: TatD family hydrolase [Proteobacteria bacterium]|nr:TatD family hydrolase [Pseudomonadota bacterium]MDA0872174.1 TatD family hydrolase [Pseudomonadota bacterium]